MSKYKIVNLISELQIPSNKWVDYDLKKIDPDGMKHIWDMYSFSYTNQGLDFSASNWQEMQSKYKATALKDIDNDKEPDAFIIYKNTPFGNKLSLAGTNGKHEAKKEVVKKLIQLVNTSGWFIEASKKMEDIMSSVNAPAVTDPEKIKQIVGGEKDVEVLDNGYYTRKLSKVDKRITKRIYGKPK